MSDRLKKAAPLAVSIGVVAFVWSELTLNFNLHWFTVADGVLGIASYCLYFDEDLGLTMGA